MLMQAWEALDWRWSYLKRLGYLVRSFRNGLELARRYKRKLPCGRAVLWDGTLILHPPDRGGLTETLPEIWYEQVYTKSFDQPRPSDVVIDAGGNIGLFCIWLAKRQPQCRILAFEPFDQNHQLLAENIRSARVDCVSNYRAGLSGFSEFGQMAVTGNRSLDHRLNCQGPSDEQPKGVPVYSFADALRLSNSNRIALFKIDIEGSEYDLIDRAADADLRRVDRFAIEYHDHVRPGTVELLRSRLAATHDVKVFSHGPTYGMLYASIAAEPTSAKQ